MNTFGKTKKNILGLFEDGFETIATLSQEIAGTEPKTESKTQPSGKEKFPSSGTIEFKEKQRVEIKRKEIFFQTVKEETDEVQREKDRVFEEEINDIISNLPTEQKNRLLHYQASYKDKSIYQRAELRKKIIEEKNKTEDQEKAASIPDPAKKSHAMETAFEGGSGTQGSGTANLSAQAVG